jgi:hypothetical protein
MFVDRQEVAVVGGADAIRGQIEAMLSTIQGRVIEGEDCLNEDNVYTGEDTASQDEDSLGVNEVGEAHPTPTTPVKIDP